MCHDLLSFSFWLARIRYACAFHTSGVFKICLLALLVLAHPVNTSDELTFPFADEQKAHKLIKVVWTNDTFPRAIKTFYEAGTCPDLAKKAWQFFLVLLEKRASMMQKYHKNNYLVGPTTYDPVHFAEKLEHVGHSFHYACL
ncbi:E3 ubiquitin-protein ligase UPL2-like [Melia azedarach]|uniref:E3 ubiquitin-protein ligase UPL2-like n=1 Tax=Melia azedarach TaxID=155640 RepID=A0ACC1XGK4_MELAZ|nr:E3 ubiquitin-protein ligase UPL2-like [Melia azedarach]